VRRGARVQLRRSSSGRPRAATAVGPGAFGHGDVATSLVMVFPLLLIYQLCIVVVPSVVATDPISRLLFSACHGRAGYLLTQAAIATAFLAWIHRSGRARALALSAVAPVAVEGLGIAIVLWLGLPLLLHRLFGLGLGASAVGAIGAGVYEELVFRLLLMGGIVTVARAAGVPARVAAIGAALLSAVVFAAAHHLGGAGEAFAPAAFGFRVLAGVALGATFWMRSLAHAVYAHVAFDLLVLVSH
jgi:membrane protease YdiL (CAAX protease family)